MKNLAKFNIRHDGFSFEKFCFGLDVDHDIIKQLSSTKKTPNFYGVILNRRTLFNRMYSDLQDKQQRILIYEVDQREIV